MPLILTLTTVDFTWHTFIGCAVTIIVRNLSRMLRRRAG